MTTSPAFALNKLNRIIRWVSIAPLYLFAEHALAETIISSDRQIDGATSEDSYIIRNNATLTAIGAVTGQISADLGAAFDATGTTITSATPISGVGLKLANSTATVRGNSVITGIKFGVELQRVSGTDVGSDAHIFNSAIIGSNRGVGISSASSLELNGSQVIGQTNDGIQVFGLGVVDATDSTITGATNGMSIRWDPSIAGTTRVDLNNSHIEGGSGPAILVGLGAKDPATANINLSNGSTLHSGVVDANGYGKLLEVSDSSTVNFNVDNSALVGNIHASSGAILDMTLQNSATLTGQLEGLKSLAIDNNAQWMMVADSDIANLSMSSGGAIKFGEPGDFYRLSVGNLSGNGTFVMDADFTAGQVDFLDVTGTATGSHQLIVGSSGADPLADTRLHVVHIANGDAQFALTNGRVDLGTYSYDLIQSTPNDWYLASSGQISPGTQSVLALFNTAPTVWYGELTTLRSRMGELRTDPNNAGGWLRAYGNEFNVSTGDGVNYRQQQQGLSFGADAPLSIGDGQWLAGVMGGYSKSALDLAQGTTGTVKSYYVGAYATWLDAPSGYYVDSVLKFNRLHNDSDVALSDGQHTKGNYDNNSVGASVEFGRHIKLHDGYFIEPYTQWSALLIQGQNYTLDNGLQAAGNRTRSLLGKVGSTVGRNFDLGLGRVVQPYVRAAYVREFAKNNEVKVNDNVFNNDLAGSRGELGVGVALNFAEQWQVHADFDYSNGDKIEQPWGANVGIRYTW